jgi:hypothetical protein
MFWRKKKAQAKQKVDEVAIAANDLVEKTMVIGPTGVLLLLGAAAVGAAATYYVAKTRKGAKPAPGEAATPALPRSEDGNKKAAR